MKEITMSNKMSYLVIATLFVGTVRGEEGPANQQDHFDPVGHWINHYYSVSEKKARRFSDNTVPNFRHLEDLPSKPCYLWRTEKQPGVDAMYGSNKTFSENLVKEMDDILVPVIHAIPEARIPTAAELKNSWQWNRNPFRSYQKFGDLWQKIVNKNVDYCDSRRTVDRDIPQQPLSDTASKQIQREAMKREKKILKEATHVLATAKEASMWAHAANEKAEYGVLDDFEKNSCPLEGGNEVCKNLNYVLRDLNREKELLLENHNRASAMLHMLHDRQAFLREAQRDMKKVWARD
jgi:hypothetical protein